MKKITSVSFIAICCIALMGITAATSDKKNAMAEVNQVQGVYIFVDSKPTSPYDYLGTVKGGGGGVGWNPQYQPVRDNMVKKIKKEYPLADGVIFSFNPAGTDHADAIKFK